MKTKLNKTAKIFLVLSILLFAVSLTQKSFYTNGALEGTPGFLPLLLGFGIIVYDLIAFFVWLTNPFILLSWILIKDIKKSFIFSLLAVICSTSFFFDKIASEGGATEITHYDIGYWLWLASMVVMLIGNIVQYTRKANKEDAISM